MANETPEPDRETKSMFPGNDLALELMREHTLLNVMAARMRESADGLERGNPVNRVRLERGLEVHRRYLIEVHHEHERLVDEALAASRDPTARARADDCALEHPKAAAYQGAVRALLAKTRGSAAPDGVALGRLIRQEADRLEEHHGKEDDVYRRLDRLLAPAERARLLGAIRTFDASHVSAEIALIAWAAQIHPSAD
ncbi:MAG: hypothetical protein L3K09_01715 [Thermoplasmata archaeon]|nr:hypothetical protein [Thermoplasmata archaeon]